MPLLVVATLLAGCAGPGRRGSGHPPETAADAGSPRPVLRPGTPEPGAVHTAEALDSASRADRSAALAEGGQDGALRVLGRSVVSLGDPARPGFWLETALVSAPVRGRVENPANGRAVAVDLLPLPASAGGGCLSPAAMRLLGLNLTDLAELIVHGP